MSKNYTKLVPGTTTVLVRTNGEGTAVIDEGPLARGPARAPRRLTRSKHALDNAIPVSPRRKRTRCRPAGSGLLHCVSCDCITCGAQLHAWFSVC